MEVLNHRQQDLSPLVSFSFLVKLMQHMKAGMGFESPEGPSMVSFELKLMPSQYHPQDLQLP